jgi:Lysozyme like domain
MSTLTYAQLEGLWINNGGSKAVAPLAAAIAEAESSGNTAATSANPDGGINVGLWQLDTKGKGAGHTVADLKDPATNAAVAVQGSNDGTDWSAWETFVTGAYKRFMNAGTTPDLSAPGGGAASAAASDAQAASAGPDCAFSIGGQHIGILFGHGPTLPSACLISKTEVRAVLGALIMVAGGLVMMPGLVIVMAYGFKATGGMQAAAKVAPYLGPYGKAVGTVAKGAGRGAQRGGRVAGRGAGAAGRSAGRGAGAAGRAAGNRATRRAENAPPVVTDPAAGV